MNVTLADHYGMCFGVRDALRLTYDLAQSEPVTILGQLVHNPVVDGYLDAMGVQNGNLEALDSAPTKHVVVTAHGAADSLKQQWHDSGHLVSDTTCPLVKKAHRALESLVSAGYAPVVIGKPTHVEVRGLIHDFPDAQVILTEADADALPFQERIGVVAQTTQPILWVQHLVERIRATHPEAEVKFIDTVCQPTKDRQTALEKLCAANDTIVVVGGRNSNNTGQLVRRAQDLGCTAYHVEGPDDLDPTWFRGAENVGVTAGTSTLDETVRDVFERLKQFANDAKAHPLTRLVRRMSA